MSLNCRQRNVEAHFMFDYFSNSPPVNSFAALPGFVPLQLTVDKFILNRTATTAMDSYVRRRYPCHVNRCPL